MTSTLVIMAAGAGSRFGGPKQLEPVGPDGETLFEYGLFDAARAGFDRVVFIIRAEHEAAFRERQPRWPRRLEVDYAIQRLDDLPAGFTAEGRAKPWGTTHAVLAARGLLHGPFAVVNADDFYGADAYRLAAEATRRAATDGAGTVVGMRLDRTLSENGAVTRGVCEVRDGRVTMLDEMRGVERKHGVIHGRSPRGERTFTGAELVSMNCWVFPHTIVGHLSRHFDAFLRNPARAADAEAMLPDTLNALVAEGHARLAAVEAPGPYFGLTHAADRPAVRQGLEKLAAEGKYPRPLLTRA